MEKIVTSNNLVGEEDEGSTKESAKVLSKHVVAELLIYWYWDIEHEVAKLRQTLIN